MHYYYYGYNLKTIICVDIRLYILFYCLINTVIFSICIKIFIKSYSGYKRPIFPIIEIAIQNINILNIVPQERHNEVMKSLENVIAQRFINDAISNRELKKLKVINMIKLITYTFIVTFITFAINILIDHYEAKFVNENVQQIQIQGGEINVR